MNILADGKFHSGEQLGARMGIGRSAVWKHVRALSRRGIEIHAVTGKGYRLAEPLELLNEGLLWEAMVPATRRRIPVLEIHGQTTSTNQLLLEQGPRLVSGHVCLAESQSAGRGRRGRTWHSPYGRNLYCSLGWRFPEVPPSFPALGLAVAVGLARTLQSLGLAGVQLKWPNDVQWCGRKLAGILVEMSGESHGPCTVVVGVGLNILMSPSSTAIDQPWVDLSTALGERVSRNRVCARMLDHLVDVLQVFQDEGLAPFVAEWQAIDALYGKAVTLESGGHTLHGVARGIDARGALLIRHDEGMKRYMAGDVSIRKGHDTPA